MALNKKKCWLLIADRSHKELPLIIPTLAWMAESVGTLLETYLECQRNGQLFAETGSTVIGGYHHQQFNYLHAAFDMEYILLGKTNVFTSSIRRFGHKPIAECDNALELYQVLMALSTWPFVSVYGLELEFMYHVTGHARNYGN